VGFVCCHRSDLLLNAQVSPEEVNAYVEKEPLEVCVCVYVLCCVRVCCAVLHCTVLWMKFDNCPCCSSKLGVSN